MAEFTQDAYIESRDFEIIQRRGVRGGGGCIEHGVVKQLNACKLFTGILIGGGGRKLEARYAN